MTMSEEAKRARREYMKKWREENRQHVKEYNRKYRENNRDKIALHQERYWTKKFQETANNG